MKRIYFAVFVVSFSVLMFEVSLTRIFSVYLWYHFAFMVISIAMLGTGSAGTMISLFSAGRKSRLQQILLDESFIPVCSLLAGISLITGYILSNHIPFDPARFSWEKQQILYLALYCATLGIPFFFAGLLISSLFIIHNRKSASVYAADMLGAGTGSVAVLLLLNTGGPENPVVIASICCLTGAFISGGSKVRLPALFLVFSIVALILLHPEFIDIRMSPYKKLSLYMKHPGAEHLNTYHSSYAQIDTFKSPAARYAPGLSLKYTKKLPEQTGIAVDGETINAVTRQSSSSVLEFLEFLPPAAAYTLGRTDNVMVIDPKGGLHVLMAEYFGASNIVKTESNPLMAEVVRDELSDFAGGIYRENVHTGYGRNLLRTMQLQEHDARRFDIIDIPMTGASVGGMSGISEDYRYTVEAFTTYISALDNDGILSVSFYMLPPPRTEFRILSTIVRAFENLGIKHADRRLAAIRSWDSITILARKSAFNGRMISELKSFADNRLFDILYYPGITEEETARHIKMSSNEYYRGFRYIVNPETREDFISNYLFDISPVYDNNPFFHHYLKIKNIKKIYNVMGRNWLYFLEEGYLIPVIFVTVFLLSAGLIILPVAAGKRHGLHAKFNRGAGLILLYFAMLGTGFMFLEISFIQKSIRVLENPSYAFAVVLTVILISSGTGSMLSSRIPALRSPSMLIVLMVMILLYTFLFPFFHESPAANSFSSGLVIGMLVLPGFVMGIPFPYGMIILGEKHPTLIPWAWAVNACFSVLAPVLAIMIALASGFNTVLFLAAAAYLTAFTALKKINNQ